MGKHCHHVEVDRFRLLTNQAAIGIEQISLEGTLLEANDALCSTLGYSLDEICGKPLAELVHPEQVTEALKQHQQLIQGAISHFTLKTRYLRKDGLPGSGSM